MPCSEIAPHWSSISLALATLVCGAAAAGPSAATFWRGPSAYTAMIRSHDGFGNLLVGCVKDTFQQIAFVRFSTAWMLTAPPPQ